MRFLLGVIVGAILTIGVAYLSDASASGSSDATAQTSVEQRPMVNWDVVRTKWHGLTVDVHNTWNKLAGR